MWDFILNQTSWYICPSEEAIIGYNFMDVRKEGYEKMFSRRIK